MDGVLGADSFRSMAEGTRSSRTRERRNTLRIFFVRCWARVIAGTVRVTMVGKKLQESDHILDDLACILIGQDLLIIGLPNLLGLLDQRATVARHGNPAPDRPSVFERDARTPMWPVRTPAPDHRQLAAGFRRRANSRSLARNAASIWGISSAKGSDLP